MGSYVDVFVVPVPKNNIKDYRENAELFGKVWREHGALSFIEVEADDAPVGKVTSFPQSVDLKPDETVFVRADPERSARVRNETANAGGGPRFGIPLIEGVALDPVVAELQPIETAAVGADPQMSMCIDV